MSRLLIQYNNSLKELYGNQYINLNELDENLEEIKVTKVIEKKELEINGEKTIGLIVKNPIESVHFYDEFEISKSSDKLSISEFDTNDKISFNSMNSLLINDSQKEIYVNFKLVLDKVIKYNVGDVIHIEDYISLTIKDDNKIEITVYQNGLVKVKLPLLDGTYKEYKDFPIYTNSPKMTYKIKDEQIELQGPPETEKKLNVKDVVKRVLPSIITMVLTLIIAYFKPRGPYIIISVTTTVMTITFSITSYLSDRKENKRYNEKRKEIYKEYLKEQRAKLVLLKREEEEILKKSFLNISGILEEINKNSSRLYERDVDSEEFLKINIGKINKEPTYKIKNPINKLQVDKDPLELEVEEIYEDFKELKDVPKVIDLLSSNVGIVGSKDILNEQMQNILMQLVFFHSYLDVKLIHVIDKKERKYYNKFANTKHSQFGGDGIYSIIDTEEIRDALFSPIIQMFREREDAIKEKKTISGPMFIFIVSNYELIANHGIMEFLNKDKTNLGFSIIFLTQRHENLINNINTVVEIKNRQQGNLIIENKVVAHEKFILNNLENEDKITKNIKKVGQLEHIKGVKSSIPEGITFLEMYNVERVEDLGISKRWNENQTYKTIKALLGKKSKTDEVYLDLHEKVHGPHGLVAGTTGSGKSEVIQTYILSLAANYSPYQVGFLLIDYKGGGMANLFKDMPHLLGSITNLDGYQAMRAMASIKSELKRRQAIFSKFDVNHINGYHKLFEAGKVKEPLPHLFLISDEFAELKSNEPEFMKELVSAARIGRSLGVHLILATQKPSGVVDDQIWSNSKFKLCLKVAEEADSRELLKTPDAAYISQPGRGYLKVGTNELYEQFQSGYSGATYNENKEVSKDNRIFVIDEYGQSRLINEDLSGNEKVDIEKIDELRAVLNEVNNVYENNDYIPVSKPWLPPLKDKMIMNTKVKVFSNKPNMKVSIGLIDLPDRQAQQELELNFEENPTLLIIGGPSSGKTTTIMTTILSLALQNDANMLEYYLLDFGSSGLIQAKGLNQTADYIKVDELDKISKFKKRMQKEIKIRKRLLEDKMVSNVKSYNQIAKDKLKSIVIVIDNYDIIKDEGIDPNYEIVKLIKDGLALGIYPIISVSRLGALNMAMQGIMTNRIVHYIEEKTELNTAIGRSEYEAQNKVGRIQLKLEKPEVAQIYFQSEGETGEEIIHNTNKIIQSINEVCTSKNEGLPVMPEVVEFKEEYKQKDKIFIGLDYEDINTNYLEHEDILVYGTGGKGKSSIITNILSQIDKEIYILDDNNYTAQSKQMKGKIFESDNAGELLQILEQELNELIEVFNQRREQESNFTFHDYKKEVSGKVIYINQAQFLTKLQLAEKPKFAAVLSGLSKVGYMLIYEIDNIMEINDVAKIAKESKQKLYVGDPALQTLVKVGIGNKPTKANQVYLFNQENRLLKVK